MGCRYWYSPFCVSQDFQRTVGDDLIGVHVRRRPGTTLDNVHHEPLMQFPRNDFVAGPDDGPGPDIVKESQFMVGLSCSV